MSQSKFEFECEVLEVRIAKCQDSEWVLRVAPTVEFRTGKSALVLPFGVKSSTTSYAFVYDKYIELKIDGFGSCCSYVTNLLPKVKLRLIVISGRRKDGPKVPLNSDITVM